MSYSRIGYLTLKDEVMVSDPGYHYGTWCQGIVKNLQPGKYAAYIEHCDSDDDFFNGRIASLTIIHEDKEPCVRLHEIEYDECCDFEVGVDSGLAGFFDVEYFKKYHEPDLNENWYNTIVINSFSDRYIGENYTFSSSGIGDGSYDCYVAYNKETNKVDTLKIVFLDTDIMEDEELYEDIEDDLNED